MPGRVEPEGVMCVARRVLVVDDDPLLRRLLATLLAAEGFVVAAAADGADALAKLPEADPCAILVDLHMPVLDGLGFGRAYHALPAADAVIIAMSAEPMPSTLDDLRPVEFVRKPFQLDQLVAVVERAVRAHAPRVS